MGDVLQDKRPLPLSSERGLAGRAWEDTTPVWIADVSHEPTYSHSLLISVHPIQIFVSLWIQWCICLLHETRSNWLTGFKFPVFLRDLVVGGLWRFSCIIHFIEVEYGAFDVPVLFRDSVIGVLEFVRRFLKKPHADLLREIRDLSHTNWLVRGFFTCSREDGEWMSSEVL